MKKIIYSAMAVAMLATTSCKDDFAESFVGDEATVEFSISTPEIGTRAFSDGATATVLQYAVYDADGKELTALTKTDGTINGSATISLQLKNNKSYQMVVWAAAPNAPYAVDFSDKTMKVDYTKATCNDESRDAFYAYTEFTVNGNKTERIELKRPFAQLNIGASDFEKAGKSGYVPTHSQVTVRNVYSTFNFASGKAGGENEITFKYAELPNATDGSFPVTGNDYLAMNYILVGNDQETVEVYVEHKNDKEGDSKTIGSVPLKRNYRTNIYGNLLTSTTDVNVEIVPDYNEPDYNNKYEVSTATDLQDAIYDAVAAGNGVITLTADITVNEIITIGGTNTRSNADAQNAQIVIEGNGKTLTYTGKGVDARAITVESTANGTNLTLKNLTVNCISSYCQRGINYNTNGTLKLDGVTVKGTNVTYALNLPGSSDGANVTINNSSLTGNIALNVWGENATINATGSHFTSVDNSDAENYSAIVLNSDGTTIANGTTVNIDGGSITAKDEKGEPSYAVRNSTATGEVNVSETTSVVGTIANPVAILTYANTDQFYSFATLQAAIDFAKDGETITLIRDIVFDEETRTHNSGTYYDGLYYIGDKSFTIDLNGKTISQDGSVNDYLLNFKNDGTKANTITFKNGTIDAGRSAYCALCTSTTSTQKITINLNDIELTGNNSNGAVLKIRGGTVLNVKNGTIITGINSYTGIEAVGSETVVNIYNGAEIYQNGTSSYVGSLAGVSNNATMNVYGGSGKSAQGGFIAMTSGGTINVYGGEWIANTDGTYANNNNSVLIAQSGNGAKCKVNVTGGTFKGGYNCYGNAVGDAQINISGGNFNANPSFYVAAGYKAVKQNDGTWAVVVE
ncbi:MAG: DUF6562 domain-containing protein [Muribaculaceae bacterium]|nr:DUF6562 domain-containing protein [Muribaculaceae bacterium]